MKTFSAQCTQIDEVRVSQIHGVAVVVDSRSR